VNVNIDSLHIRAIEEIKRILLLEFPCDANVDEYQTHTMALRFDIFRLDAPRLPMNVRKMRQIDRWVGAPLCFGFTLLRACLPERREAGPIRSLVFIKLAEQGSTVLAYPALHKAVERVGRDNVFMIVFADNRFIVDVLDVIPPENVITVRSDSFLALLSSAVAGILRLRKRQVDAAVDLEFFARSSALLTYLSGARFRSGFHAYFGEGPYRGNLMTHRVRYNPHLHTTQSFAMLLQALDFPPENFPTFNALPEPTDKVLPSFAPRAEEVADVEALIEHHTGLAVPPPLILLNANASDLIPLRRWNTDRYITLAQRLLAHYPEIFIAFTGAAEEAPKVENAVQRIGSPRCFSLAGQTTLRQLMVLYGLADVMVTNDSGPAHFASLTTIHTVTLFGPESPHLFAATTKRNKPIWAGLVCSPCVSALNNRSSACRDNVCMQRITVDQVFAAVCESYKERTRLRPESVTSRQAVAIQ
jgi:ADP-heptose:LPS heptosyltransferase